MSIDRQPAPAIGRVVSSIVIPLNIKNNRPDWQPPDGWAPGPYAEQWRAGTPKTVEGSVTGRLRYMNEGLEPVLFRRPTRVFRWNRVTAEKSSRPFADNFSDNTKLIALELMRTPFKSGIPDALLVAHVELDTSIGASKIGKLLNELTNHNPSHENGRRAAFQELVAPFATISPEHRRAQHITLVTATAAGWPDPGSGAAGSIAWLAHLAASGRYHPDRASAEGSDTRLVWMSNGVRGMSSRDGFVMALLQPDTGKSNGQDGFDADGAQFFARGMYTDVLLLSSLQRLGLQAIGRDLSAMYGTTPSSRQMSAVEDSLKNFRTHIWRQEFAPQGSQDRVLLDLQELQGLPTREAALGRDLAEISAQISRSDQRSVTGLLRFLTFVGVIWGFLWAALGLVDDNWKYWLPAGLAAIVVVLLLTHRGTRLALGIPERERRRSKSPMTHMNWYSLD